MQKKHEIEEKFQKMKEREKQLIEMLEKNNKDEKEQTTELKTLLFGKNGENIENGSMPLNGTMLKKNKL